MRYAKWGCSHCCARNRRMLLPTTRLRPELVVEVNQAAKRNELRMAGGAEVPAVAEPAGGIAHRHLAGGDWRGGGRHPSGDRAFDEHGISPGHSRPADER